MCTCLRSVVGIGVTVVVVMSWVVDGRVLEVARRICGF
jgi:hypothetical protein